MITSHVHFLDYSDGILRDVSFYKKSMLCLDKWCNIWLPVVKIIASMITKNDTMNLTCYSEKLNFTTWQYDEINDNFFTTYFNDIPLLFPSENIK